MMSFLQEAAAITQDEYDIRFLHRGQPVRDHDRGSAFGCAVESILDEPLVFCVQCAGGLVE